MTHGFFINMSTTHKPTTFILKALFLCLCLILFLRALTLEIPNLTDPTEGRYALGALDMLKDNQYLVPQILRGDVREPYLGKPPMFFWAASASMALLGTEEWSVRLPSFICFLLITVIIISFGKIVGNELLGINAALVWTSSLLPFFLAGTVSFDPLLTLFVSALLVIAYLLLNDSEDNPDGHKSRKFYKNMLFWRIFFWFLSGAGVLVKGPVIALYVAMPIFFFCLFSKSLKSSFRKLGIFYGPFIALLVFIPWFIAAEKSNPGFIKYFLFSENFKRFLVKDYGDRYGTGHEYPYGFSLLFLFAGAFPWSFAALGKLRSFSLSNIGIFKSRLFKEPELRFAVCWAFSAPLVLVFARQMHPGYVLPALPGFSILIILLLGTERISKFSRSFIRILIPCISIAALYPIISDLLGLSLSLQIVMFLILLGVSLAIQIPRLRDFGIAQSACCAALVYVAVLIGANKYVNEQNSTLQILGCISQNVPIEEHLKVALIEVKQYAAYFFADTWKQEIGRELDVEYKDFDDLPTTLPTHIIVKASKQKSLKLTPDYKRIAQVGPFLWLSNDPGYHNKVVCNSTDF